VLPLIGAEKEIASAPRKAMIWTRRRIDIGGFLPTPPAISIWARAVAPYEGADVK